MSPSRSPRPITWPIAVTFTIVLALAGCGGDAGPAATTPPAEEPTPTEAPEPTVVLLAGDLKLDAGACTSLEWRTENVLRAYLDGQGVDPSGEREVCPEETRDYTLSATASDGSELTRTVTIEVTAATPTPTDTPVPTRVPVTAAPSATPTATAEPTEQAAVEFYPDNWFFELPADQKCAAVNWRTRGVTDVELQIGDGSRDPVPASGRQGDICFGGNKITFRLFYKLPDGTEEKQEFELRRERP
jgi:hypothetical protein